MTTTTLAAPRLISREELVKRFNNQSHIANCERAALYKTGVLDVELLMDGLGYVEPSLLECAKVSVTFAAMTRNPLARRVEAVFDAYDSKGARVGTYLASAFKSLSL